MDDKIKTLCAMELEKATADVRFRNLAGGFSITDLREMGKHLKLTGLSSLLKEDLVKTIQDHEQNRANYAQLLDDAKGSNLSAEEKLFQKR